MQSEWFTSEFLNEIKCLGIPNHRLKLKIGVPIMLVRSIDQAKRSMQWNKIASQSFRKKCHLNNYYYREKRW